MLKVSVIIATYNAEEHLEEAINSLINQTYKNLEIIVIDGLSKDRTVDILKSYGEKIKYISEKDKGISDAFNKGIQLSTGDFIYFLGADDFLLTNTVIEEIMKDIVKEEMLICGKIKRVDIYGKKTLWIAPKKNEFKKSSLLFKMSLPHQGLFTNREFFNKYGMFDIKNTFSMDYELLLRAYKSFPKVKMKDMAVAAWREGGVGKDRTLEIFKEYYKIKLKNRVAPVFILRFIYWLNILKYMLKKMIMRGY